MTMEHACSRQDTDLHKQTAASKSSRHAPYALKRSLNIIYVPFDLSLVVKTCRARQYGCRCTAKLSEVTG